MEKMNKFSKKMRVNSKKYVFSIVIMMMAGFQLSCDEPLPTYYDPRFHNEPENCNVFFQTSINAVAVDERTGNMFAGGSFCSVDGVTAYNIVFYDKTKDKFYTLAGGGLVNEKAEEDSYVRSMAISGKYLYVGGRFSRTADLNNPEIGMNNIARYDIDLKMWSSLSEEGVNGDVNALVFSGNHLYVGGSFSETVAGLSNLNNIARYEEANSCDFACWQPLPGNGLNNTVHALEISHAFPNNVFVGGEFTQTHNGSLTNLNRITRFEGNSWHPLYGDGLNDTVRALKAEGGYIYIGGNFTATANPSQPNLVPINRIAKYEFPSNFHPYYPVPGEGLDGEVNALAVKDSVIVAGGNFTRSHNAETLNLGNIAFNDSSISQEWTAFPGSGLNAAVNALTFTSGNTIHRLFVGGTFSQSADGTTLTNLRRLVSFDFQINNLSASSNDGVPGNNWAKLGFSNVKALDRDVFASTVDANGIIYVGGNFLKTADGAITNLNRIARYDPATKTWSALANHGLNGPVNALAVSGDHLYVGGQFTGTTDSSVTNLNNIAVYNLTTNTWSALPGNGLNNWVYDLVVSGNTLFVGGVFTRTFNSSVLNLNRVARFNTSTNIWSTVSGNGLNNSVFAMASIGENIYFGGAFTQTQTFTSFNNLNRVARYHIPTDTWFLVPTNGLNAPVIGLATLNNFLYLRGTFTATADNSISLNRLARFDTSTDQWSPITNNRDLALETLETLQIGNDLYIGGSFTDLGESTARYFTRIYLQQWNNSSTNSDWFDNTNWRLGTIPTFNSSVVIPAGSGNIQINSADVILDDLMLNGGTLTIGAGRTLTINGILNLSGGNINGDGTVIIANCQPDGILGGDSTSYIQTALVRCVNNTGTFNFEVGTESNNSPVTVKGIIGTGNILVKANQGAYSGAAAGLPSNRLARWWQIENPGGGVTNADVHFNFPQSDVYGAETNYRAYRISGGTAGLVQSSVNTFSNYVTAEDVTQFSDWTLAELSPTAAGSSISGRVISADGRPIRNATVTVSGNSLIQPRTVQTGSFGYYMVSDLTAGETYVVSVMQRRFTFGTPARVVVLSGDIAGLDFVAIHLEPDSSKRNR